MSEVQFSVIIPTYNRSAFIERTIRSVLSQSIQDFEVIVVDDGSTDDTKKVVEGIRDSRIRYHYKENEERAVARNTGARLAGGKYLTFLDSDDLVYPNHLETAAEMISRYDSPEWFHLGYEFVNGDGKTSRKVDNLPETANELLIGGNHLSCDGIFLRRDIASRFRFTHDRDLSGTEDYELWLRLASRYPLYCSNKVTSAIVNHDNRSVLTSNQEKLIRRIELLERYVLADGEFRHRFGGQINRFKANNRLYISLHLALSRSNRFGAVKYLVKALSASPHALRNRAFYGTIKRLFV